MMKKMIIIGFMVCVGIVSFGLAYFSNDRMIESEKTLKTVVFKDRDGDLIPVSVNFLTKNEQETDMRNYIDFMKSMDLADYGLYPIIDDKVVVQSVESKNKRMTINFNEMINQNSPLDLIEALTYVALNNFDIEGIELKVNNKNITHLSREYLPVGLLTKELGMNNFEDSSLLLHQTKSVMVFQQKEVDQFSYYVPIMLRVDEGESLFSQVSLVLNYINAKLHLLAANLKGEELTIELDSIALLDNEKIDHHLEELIVLSLSSLEGVQHVKIIVDGENVSKSNVSSLQFNYIKI